MSAWFNDCIGRSAMKIASSSSASLLDGQKQLRFSLNVAQIEQRQRRKTFLIADTACATWCDKCGGK